MNVFNSTTLGKSSIKVEFGMADTKTELGEMFRLRYRIYALKKKYIPSNLVLQGVEADCHDKEGKCKYFLAKVGAQLVGSTRLIQSNPLPIFHYYQFEEPAALKAIDVSQKAEIGRLISVGAAYGVPIPRHAIPLGLFDSMLHYCEANNIAAVYGAMKEYIVKGMAEVNLPLNFIEGARLVFDRRSDDPLKNFFHNENDPVVPLYVKTVDYRAHTISRRKSIPGLACDSWRPISKQVKAQYAL